MKTTLALIAFSLASAHGAFEIGIGSADITPPVGDGAKAVWIAGYGMGRSATGVHDPLFARALVMRDTTADQKIALVSVDLVGLQRPAVLRVREKLEGYDHVLVSSTHNHEGPDVVGMWGANPMRSGVDPAYLDLVIAGCLKAVGEAEGKLARASASYGTAVDDSLVGDSRLPKAYEGKMRVIRFAAEEDETEALGLMVVWNCHPEAMGPRNRELTADFPAATIAALEEKHDCPVAYFTGTVGGLLAPPDNRIKDAAGKVLHEGDWEYMRLYGEAVAALADKALAGAESIKLTPFRIAAKAVQLPVENKLYRAGFTAAILQRDAYVFEGPAKRGAPLHKIKHALRTMAIETEVAYLRLGDLSVAAIPGEIYPELVTGEFQDPVDPGADFPDAELEPTVTSLMPGDPWMVLGLAYDEVGYIIPKRQWDVKPPFAYGREKSQYGEVNSCGPDTARILLEALKARVSEIE